jgi:CheY-like chemotaxis protein
VVGEASNGQEALKLAEMLHTEVGVLDLAMPILRGIDTAKEIQRISGKTKTITPSMHTESPVGEFPPSSLQFLRLGHYSLHRIATIIPLS